MRQAAERSQLSQDRFRQLIETLDAIVWEWECPPGQFTFVSEGAETLLGFPVEMWQSEPDFWAQHLADEDRARCVACRQACLVHGEGYDLEYRMRAADGRVVWLRDKVQVVNGKPDGTVVLCGVTVALSAFNSEVRSVPGATRECSLFATPGGDHESDAHTQRVTEAGLRASEAEFRALTECIPAIVLIARQERIVYCNSATVSATGYSREELLQSDLWEHVHPDHRELVAQRHRERIQGASPPSRYEIQFVTKQGDVRWLDMSTEVIAYEGDAAVLVLGIDVTERMRAERQLREKEAELAHVARLSTMGEMVAGIAHEVNQPLYSIINYSKAISNTLSQPNEIPVAQLLRWNEQISQAAARAGDIIKRLRGYATRQEPNARPFNINDIIEDALELVRYEARRCHVDLLTQLPAEGPQVSVDRIQLQQVFVNLLFNAVEAMEQANSPVRQLEIAVAADQQRVEIAVSDTGPGLPQTNQRIFDAFVSTKPSGMGLGLAISKTIIESAGGMLFAFTNQRRGATFCFTLPRLPAPCNHAF